jgi:hypothetical protein
MRAATEKWPPKATRPEAETIAKRTATKPEAYWCGQPKPAAQDLQIKRSMLMQHSVTEAVMSVTVQDRSRTSFSQFLPHLVTEAVMSVTALDRFRTSLSKLLPHLVTEAVMSVKVQDQSRTSLSELLPKPQTLVNAERPSWFLHFSSCFSLLRLLAKRCR